MDKRVYKIEAIIPGAEVRAVELVENEFKGENGEIQKYSYIDLKVDDKNGDRIFLKDKNVDNINKYKRGDIGDFIIVIDAEEEYKKSYKITVRDFKKTK